MWELKCKECIHWTRANKTHGNCSHFNMPNVFENGACGEAEKEEEPIKFNI